jgi:hypothetical protein
MGYAGFAGLRDLALIPGILALPDLMCVARTANFVETGPGTSEV